MGKDGTAERRGDRHLQDQPIRQELVEARAQQAATAAILRTISHSPHDAQPVFDMIASNAARLCQTQYCHVFRFDGRLLNIVAHHGLDSDGFKAVRDSFPMEPNRGTAAGRAILSRAIEQIPDVSQDKDYVLMDTASHAGFLSTTAVPMMLHDGSPVGVITVMRAQPGFLANRHVDLLKTFADQAVIAIENVRRFHEVQTRLEREKASREILDVISRSRDDELPVFDVILENASHLCQVPVVSLLLLNAERTSFHVAAHRGARLEPLADDIRWSLDDPLPVAESMREARVVHIPNLCESAPYCAGHPVYVHLVEKERLRSRLCVPLIRDGVAFGTIALSRYEIRAFTDDEIQLIETFAAQAVIAIENVRQFLALEALNLELGQRVEQQVGEIERMGKLKRFLPAAVANTVISSGSEEMLSSHRALLGVLFCDIRGFTAFCETAEPEETIEVLQTYHQEMGKLINAHGAGVDHRMGDGIMVLFNDPVPCEDPAGNAVRLAIAMRARMEDLCKQWKRLGYRLGFGVGVSLGYATVGMVGYEGRFDYTASGTAINLAARLCDEAEDGEILLSPRASIAVEEEFLVEPKGMLSLKGIREPLEVFRLVDASAN